MSLVLLSPTDIFLAYFSVSSISFGGCHVFAEPLLSGEQLANVLPFLEDVLARN